MGICSILSPICGLPTLSAQHSYLSLSALSSLARVQVGQPFDVTIWKTILNSEPFFDPETSEDVEGFLWQETDAVANILFMVFLRPKWRA